MFIKNRKPRSFMTRGKMFAFTSTGAAVLGLATSGAAVAQTEKPIASGNADEGVIVVTATKRAESLNRVPIAVSAMDGEAMDRLRIKDTYAIVSQVPNMVVDSGVGAHAVPQFNLRGVGTNDVFATAMPGVGVYYDEVYVNSVFGQGIPLFDQERVEVLRGPQGTLWGKNTTGGAVNIISRRPDEKMDAYAQVTYGNYNFGEFEGAVGGPIVEDRLSARISAFGATRKGFYKNTARDERVNDYDDLAFRGQLLWKPSDRFTARFVGTLRREHETSYYASFGLLPGGTNAFGYSDETRDGKIGNDESNPVSIHTDVALLDLRHELGSGLEFVSISGYIRNSFRSKFDVDGSPVPFFIGRQDVDVKQYSEELRLASDSTKKIRFILGGFFLREDLNGSNPDALPAVPAFDSVRLIDQRTTSLAGFANLEYEFSDVLTARVGGRYTSERKRIDLVASLYTPGLDPLNLNQAANFIPFEVADGVKQKDDKFTWDISLQYNPTSHFMAFARVAHGFKGSIFNASVFAPGDFSVADPETLTDFELGIKSTLFGGKANLNLTGFYYAYRNFQVQQFVATAGGFSSRYGNADKARAVGIEAELAIRPVSDLLLSLNAGYTNANFTDFKNAAVSVEVNSGQPLDISGERLPRAPRATASFLAQYTWRGDAGDFTVRTNWNYVSKIDYDLWLGIPASELLVQPAFQPFLEVARRTLAEDSRILGGARISYAFGAERNAELSLWVKNITDKYYRTDRYAFFSALQVGGHIGDPRTFGATFAYRF